ncbi:MAG TPA: hypothetical protein DEB40_06885 [Elusimicrobia bacterium]|nr:hypothetical protein [Elusimicrobiota bacterium]HBT61453.1 hypothetical protein [Elusimicrobiota bacterium]
MNGSLKGELGRKAFHMLSLVYLAVYHWLGFPRAVMALGAWLVFVTAVEAGRFYSDRLSRGLQWIFRGMIRQTEQRSFSGIFHTTMGSFLTVLLAGGHARIVTAALAWLALGDAAAALAGKTLGRHPIAGGRKSLEGSLACLATCLAVGLALGLRPAAALAGSLAATIAELLPSTRFYNDNLFMPVAAAAALLAFGAR